MKKHRAIILMMGLGLFGLLCLHTNCSSSGSFKKAQETQTGSPLIELYFKAHTVSLNLELCLTRADLLFQGQTKLSIPLNTNRISVASSEQKFDTITIPKGLYDQVALRLEANCVSGQNLSFINGAQSYSSGDEIKLFFSGSLDLQGSGRLDFDLQPLIDALQAITDSAQVTLTANSSLGTVVHQVSSRVLVTLEAEAGVLSAPMQIQTDAGASGTNYVTSTTVDSGTVTLTVNLVSPGDYVIWGKVLAPDFLADSFFVSVDGGVEDIYDTAEGVWSGIWQWTKINGRNGGPSPLALNPRTFRLSSGAHQIVFRMREPNSTLDQITITNDLSFVP